MTGITKADMAAISHDAWTADNIAAGGVCDFCLAVLDPETCSTFTANGELSDIIVAPDGSVIEHVADPYWGACPACAPVVEFGSPEKLAAHVIETTDYDRLGIEALVAPRTREKARAIMQKDLTDLYRRLFKIGVVRSEGPPAE